MLRILSFTVLMISWIGFAMAAHAQSSPRSVFDELSKNRQPQPEMLVSAEGDTHFFRISSDKTFKIDGIAIGYPNEKPIVFSGPIEVTAFLKIPGHYLISERVDEGQRLWLSILKNNRFVISDSIIVPTKGRLLPMPDGNIWALETKQIVTGVAKLEKGQLVVGEGQEIDIKLPEFQLLPDDIAGAERKYAASLLKGLVEHPVTGEAGIVLMHSRDRFAEFLFASGQRLKVPLGGKIRTVVAANATQFLATVLDPCGGREDAIKKLCRAKLYLFDIPSASKTIKEEDGQLIYSPPDWGVFGVNNLSSADRDVRFLDDRILVILAHGTRQALQEIKLDDLANPRYLLKPMDGRKLRFGALYWSDAGQIAALDEIHYFRPKRLHFSLPETGLAQISEDNNHQALAQYDLRMAKPKRGNAIDSVPYFYVGNEQTVKSNKCPGPVLIETHGGIGIPLEAYSLLGYAPDFFAKNGVYYAFSVQGTGDYSQYWQSIGAYENAASQVTDLGKLIDQLVDRGCRDINLLGGSHGGVVSLNAAMQRPDKVRNVIAVVTPLDIAKEHQMGNSAVSAFLPRKRPPELEDFKKVSPLLVAQQAASLKGLRLTLIVGEKDTRIASDQDEKFIEIAKSKGADVRFIVRKNIGHDKYRSNREWSEFYFLVNRAMFGL